MSVASQEAKRMDRVRRAAVWLKLKEVEMSEARSVYVTANASNEQAKSELEEAWREFRNYIEAV